MNFWGGWRGREREEHGAQLRERECKRILGHVAGVIKANFLGYFSADVTKDLDCFSVISSFELVFLLMVAPCWDRLVKLCVGYTERQGFSLV